MDNQPTGRPVALTGRMDRQEFTACLEAIGWSARQFCDRTHTSRWIVAQALDGQRPIPDVVAAYVRALAAFHRSIPAPAWSDPHPPAAA